MKRAVFAAALASKLTAARLARTPFGGRCAKNGGNLQETACAEWICRLICSKGLGDIRPSW